MKYKRQMIEKLTRPKVFQIKYHYIVKHLKNRLRNIEKHKLQTKGIKDGVPLWNEY